MSTQKFRKGDLVLIGKNYAAAGRKAIVIGI
jgi:hypothetical protein